MHDSCFFMCKINTIWWCSISVTIIGGLRFVTITWSHRHTPFRIVSKSNTFVSVRKRSGWVPLSNWFLHQHSGATTMWLKYYLALATIQTEYSLQDVVYVLCVLLDLWHVDTVIWLENEVYALWREAWVLLKLEVVLLSLSCVSKDQEASFLANPSGGLES